MTITTNLLPVPKDKMPGKVAVLVLGMHRSGTSLLGGILERLGCQGAQTRMDANQWNAKGYFESPEVMKLNDAILDALGSRWDDSLTLDPGWQQSPRFNEFRGRIAEVMAAEYGEASLVYVKDPRICRLLPLWREALEEAGYAPVCIHIHRNPADVTRSLQVRTSAQVDPGLGMLLWLRHVLDAEAGSRGLPRIFTSYRRILSNWSEFADRAEQSFGFAWPVMKCARETRVQEMLDPALCHHDTPVAAFFANSAAPDPAKECLKILETWAEKGEDKAGQDILAEIRERFDQSTELFAPRLAEISKLRQRVRTLEAEHAGAQDAASSHEKEAAALRKDLELRQQHAEEIRKMFEADAQKLTKLVADQKSEIDRLTQEREALRQTEADLHNELRLTKDRLTQQRAEAEIRLAELQVDFDAASASLADMQAQFQSAEKEQNSLREQEGILRKALDQANRSLADIRAETEAEKVKLQADLEVLSDKVIEQAQAYDLLREELDQANSRLAQARADAEAQQFKLQEELNAFADKVIDRDRTAAALRKELSVQKQAANAQQDRVASAYANEIDKLHRAYQSSASWKFAAPIRVLGSLVRVRRRYVS